MKKRGVNEKRRILRITVRIVIMILFLLLVWLLLDSLILRSKINCNKILEFNEIQNCSNECFGNCVQRGYSSSLNHSLNDIKFIAQGTNRKAVCICDCQGCIENY